MGAAQDFLQKAVAHDGDECLIWPFYVKPDGYGLVRFRGTYTNAHRAVCRLVHGEPADTSLDAAHNCGRKLCLNPRHLRWATRQENVDDVLRHGRRAFGEDTNSVRLTETDVRSIRKRSRTVSQGKLAREYGVCRTTVHKILTNKTWRHVQ